MRRRHFVFLVTNYYPFYSAVGKCIGNIAEVISIGNKVTVICKKSTIDQENNELFDNQEIIRFENKNDIKRFRYQEKIKTSTGNKRKYYNIRLQLHRVAEAFMMLISPTSLKKQLIVNYYNSLKNIGDDIDVLIPACSPIEAIVASIIYKKEHANTKVIPILFDMFSQNALLHKTKWNRIIKFKRHLDIEEGVFEYSDYILHMPSWENHIKEYFQKYKAKSYRIEHPLIVRRNISFNKNLNIDAIRIGCCIDQSIAEEHLNKILLLCKLIIQSNNKCIIHFSGDISNKVQEFMTIYPNNCSYICNSEKITDIIKNISFLLYVGNKDIEKFFSYVQSLKPIISLGDTLSDLEKDLFSKYPYSLNIIIKNREYTLKNIEKFISTYKDKVIRFDEVYNILSANKMSYSNKIIEELINNKNYINIIFAGALNKGYVEANYLVKLVKGTILEEICRFEFYTAGSATNEIENASKSIKRCGWISKEELSAKLENSNILLSIAEINGKQISSKIFEYMSLGKPIIHLYTNDNDINLKYLYKYPVSLCVKQSMKDISNNIEQIALFCAFYMNFNINFEEVENIFSDLKPQSIVETIYNLLT